MKVNIVAVGRLRPGAELDLISDYQTRFDRTGRALSLGPLDLREVDAKKGGMAAEATLLRKASEHSLRVGLDERGKVITSPQFADLLARWRDDGHPAVSFLIGGADGLEPGLRGACDQLLSFGKMVWPHMLARVMLTEQLYRAASILAGSPYHRV